MGESRSSYESIDSDPKFLAFMEAAPDSIVVINRAGRIVMVNALAERMFGYGREAMIGETVELLVPERYHAAHGRHRRGYFHGPRARPMGDGRTLSGRRSDGSEFPVEISLSPLQTDDSTLVISIIRDVTPRKKMEAKFRGLLESAPDAIVVIGADGRIVIVNSQTEQMFGYVRGELVGQHVEILVPERAREPHVAWRDGYILHPVTRPMGAGRLLSGRRKDGVEFPVEISLSPLDTEQGTLITSIIRDITDRRVAEQQLQASLREKEALLKEIHHRVKNNLQVTSSLLRLQSDYIQDPHSRELFAESQNRIRSMALVHEKLYRSTDLSRIDLADYVGGLAQLLFGSYGADRNQIGITISGGDVHLSIGEAVPCGLIINELLSNCLKHAYPAGRQGRVQIGVHRVEAMIRLTIEDDGIGLPSDFDLGRSDTLGLQLVRTLVRQLDGEVQVRSDRGTTFTIHFPEHGAHP